MLLEPPSPNALGRLGCRRCLPRTCPDSSQRPIRNCRPSCAHALACCCSGLGHAAGARCTRSAQAGARELTQGCEACRVAACIVGAGLSGFVGRAKEILHTGVARPRQNAFAHNVWSMLQLQLKHAPSCKHGWLWCVQCAGFRQRVLSYPEVHPGCVSCGRSSGLT